MTSVDVRLADIDECFQGALVSPVCSVAPDGVPNVTRVEAIQRVGDDHVALERFGLTKTVRNMLANPRLQIILLAPSSGTQYRLNVLYERTERGGRVFERSRARIDAMAAHVLREAMHLEAVDICRVLSCEAILLSVNPLPAHLRATRAGLEALDAFSRRLASAQDLDALMSETITALVEVFGYQHCVLLVANETGDSLYAVASHGYPESGAGAEIAVGEGPIGVAATRGVPVRVTNVAIASWYARSGGDHSAREIAFPRHAQAMSQLAVPIILGDRLLGAIFLESEVVGHFGEVDEQAANVVASQVGWAMSTLRGQPVLGSGRREDPGGATRREAAAHIRHYAEDDSIFMNGDYLIKGLAGRVLWRMLQAYEEERRVEFTNKEMRLDASLELSDFRDNLENRLILLRRRLEDRCDFVRIQNTGRGRFSLVVQRELELQEIPARP